jgi:hypothetical protein
MLKSGLELVGSVVNLLLPRHTIKNSVLSVERFGEIASKETTQEKKQSLLF